MRDAERVRRATDVWPLPSEPRPDSITGLAEGLLPRGAVVRECRIPDLVEPFCPGEAPAGASPKRQREYLAGRWCARAALAAFGVPPSPLPMRPDRTPAWPDAFVGSIAHSEHYCAAAVAPRAVLVAIGIDIEEVERFDSGVLYAICTDGERAALDRAGEAARPIAGCVLFSAKEAFYKCQYTLTGSWLDFDAAEIRLLPESGAFEVNVLRGLPPELPGARFMGRYSVTRDLVATAIGIPADV